MHNHMQVLGEVVRTARLKLDLTQNEVAEQIGVDSRTVLNIENQKGNPKMEVLYPLIRTLRIDPTAIFYPERQHESQALSELKFMLAQCSEEEILALIPICETILTVLRAKDPNIIPEE